jgi:predicted ATPase
MQRFVILSGCSGGGKSTLLIELARRGFAVVEEPGRRVVKAELDGGGSALPWTDPAAFARRALRLALADLGTAAPAGWVFFDRSAIDAAAALQHATGEPATAVFAGAAHYHRRVFLAPPWPQIYAADPERRHGFEEALAEYERLSLVYPSLGYEPVVLPKAPVAKRADFILDSLLS